MKPSRQRGFILIYVVALAAALALILSQLNLQRGTSPAKLEEQLSRAVQTQEAALLLQFVSAGLHEASLKVDPRYLQFRRLLAEDPARLSEMDDALRQLKAILDQMGFAIKLGKDSKGAASEINRQGYSKILFTPTLTESRIKLGEMEYTVRILPGNALPNLNSLPADAIQRYLEFLHVPAAEAAELAASLVDWRDADNFLTEGRGAEWEYYANLDAPLAPRNGPIRSWQELAYVRGVTPDRLHLLRENFMLAPDTPATRILADSMPVDTLAALIGLRADIVRAILAAYGRLGQGEKGNAPPAQEIAEVLLGQDADRFDRLIVFQPFIDRVRIVVAGARVTLHADYDVKSKRILDRW